MGKIIERKPFRKKLSQTLSCIVFFSFTTQANTQKTPLNFRKHTIVSSLFKATDSQTTPHETVIHPIGEAAEREGQSHRVRTTSGAEPSSGTKSPTSPNGNVIHPQGEAAEGEAPWALPMEGATRAPIIDQTVGVIGSHVVTLRDLRVQNIVQFILQKESLPTDIAALVKKDALIRARDYILTDWMIQDYMTNIQTSLAIPQKDLDELISKIMLTEKKSKTEFFKNHGIGKTDVEQVATRKLRLDTFYEKQLGFRVTLLPSDISDHYQKHRIDRFLSKPLSDIESVVRADLKKERLQMEFKQWIDIQTRRSEISLLPLPSQN
ncbi:MAG: hypothetical protein KDD48_02970 [Bdellovibrionales bacterium]|nr:hypothetical protein [Bdellovibrionales bacterium]